LLPCLFQLRREDKNRVNYLTEKGEMISEEGERKASSHLLPLNGGRSGTSSSREKSLFIINRLCFDKYFKPISLRWALLEILVTSEVGLKLPEKKR